MKAFKLRAGALQFAILISTIIAVLLAVFVILINAHTLFAKKSDLLISMVQETDQQMQKSLEDFTVDRDTNFIELDELKNSSSLYHRSYWGMFGKIYVENSMQSKTFEKIALISGIPSEDYDVGLYLKETEKPLILVGNTKIQGTSYVPKRGVRPGTISGNSYYGNQLIDGKIMRSTDKLPKLPVQHLNYLKSIINAPLPISDDVFINVDAKKRHANSFKNPLKIVYSRNELRISDKIIIGKILIRSATKITVTASAVLKDVILIAPKIEIQSHVKGAFQAIASENITVGKSCAFNYPSALVVLAEDELKNDSISEATKQIFIDEKSRVKGIVCFLQDTTNNRFNPQLILSKNTEIEGVVYCEQLMELMGSVYGSLYTSEFSTKQFGSVYQNHIYNGVITNDALNDAYVGYPFEHFEHKIVKWLY